MFLQNVTLNNFRCFESLSIPLDRHLNVFVGGNGAGKTTILEIIALALAPIVSRLPFEKKAKVPTIVPSDIRLIGEDRAAPFASLTAAGQTDDKAQIVWDRTRLRDKSPATK